MDKTDRPRRVYRSRAQIAELVTAFETSGQTQQQYCHEHGLRPATFSTWLRKRLKGFASLVWASVAPGRLRFDCPTGSRSSPPPRQSHGGRLADRKAQTGQAGGNEPSCDSIKS